MLIASDIGGTKVRLAVFERRDGRLVRGVTEQVKSRTITSFPETLSDFVRRNAPKAEAVCVGVPGPVVGGSARPTNLTWHLSEEEMRERLGIPHVTLVNDLVSTVAAVPHLAGDDLAVLHAGEARGPGGRRQVYAILAPGTGTGQAFLVVENGRPVPLASEGGHVDLSPNGEIEDRLIRYLRERFGHVSVERVLCGPGLHNIYQFLRDEGIEKPSPEIDAQLASGDPAAIIANAAEQSHDPLCRRVLDIFAAILGAQAGNLVLHLMATDGAFLGGGIPPKLIGKLSDGTLVRNYVNKGRLSHLVKATPLSIVRDDHVALVGAASLAEQLLR